MWALFTVFTACDGNEIRRWKLKETKRKSKFTQNHNNYICIVHELLYSIV